MKFILKNGEHTFRADCSKSYKFMKDLQSMMEAGKRPNTIVSFNPIVSKAGRFHIAIHTVLKFVYFESGIVGKTRHHPTYGELKISYEEFKKYHIVKCGFFEASLSMDGKLKAIPQSLSPYKLTNEKAEELYKKLVPIMANIMDISVKEIIEQSKVWNGGR